MKHLPVLLSCVWVLWAAAGAQAADAWYLMSPPLRLRDDLSLTLDLDAPLSRWQQEAAFDSAPDCERHRRYMEALGKKDPQIPAHQNYFLRVRCVAATDPRLTSGPEIAPPAKAEPKPTPAPLSLDGCNIGDLIDDSICRVLGPVDAGVIRYTPGRPIIAVVVLNERITVRLVLDTGADGSMVKPERLAAAGVDLSRPAARGKAVGVTGKVEVSYFAVDFEVAGHRARVPRVAAFNTYQDSFADGLLGRDFLDRFKVVMDPAAGTVTLVPR